jgi:hypothetical protein
MKIADVPDKADRFLITRIRDALDFDSVPEWQRARQRLTRTEAQQVIAESGTHPMNDTDPSALRGDFDARMIRIPRERYPLEPHQAAAGISNRNVQHWSAWAAEGRDGDRHLVHQNPAGRWMLLKHSLGRKKTLASHLFTEWLRGGISRNRKTGDNPDRPDGNACIDFLRDSNRLKKPQEARRNTRIRRLRWRLRRQSLLPLAEVTFTAHEVSLAAAAENRIQDLSRLANLPSRAIGGTGC